MKQRILQAVDRVASRFLLHDRMRDEELELGDIEYAIENDIISIEEILDRFRSSIESALKQS